MRLCNYCGISKEESEFYSTWRKDRNTPKKTRKCKVCTRLKGKTYRSAYIPLHHRNLNSRLKNLVTKARNRSKEVSETLSEEYLLFLWEQQEGKCKYSGLPLSYEVNHPDTVSLDRIDSSIGYIEGNLQLVSTTVNRIKLDLGEETFLTYCKLIANNLSKTTQGAEPQKTDPLLTPQSKLAS